MQQTEQGNKATNLQKLKKAKFNVPAFFTVPKGLNQNKFYHYLDEKKVSKKTWYAVRSSSKTEDTKKISRAGKYYSEVGVDFTNLYSAYKKVSQSLGKAPGSIIVQTFIPTELSGVMFTSSGDNQLIINSGAGLCKPIVEGEACDEWVLDKKGNLVSKNTAQNKKSLFFRKGKLVEQSTDKPSLNKKQLKQLRKLAKKIEKFFGMPQDVEWGFYRGKLHVLQSRPVTRELPSFEEKIFYDSANIAESYSGIVLPLTHSFAAFIYEQVYYNLIHSSGVRKAKLNKFSEVFRNMVGDFYGRMYYNMNNWYKMTAFIPGYQRNKQNLEQMITSNVREEVMQEIRPSLFLYLTYPFIVVKKMLFFNFSQRSFKRKTKKFIQHFRQQPINDFTFTDCRKWFNTINSKLIQKWHIPVENDFMVMTWLGMLKKRVPEEKLNDLLTFESKTTRQIEALQKITGLFTAEDELKELLLQKNYKKLRRNLAERDEINQLVLAYFDEFGGRFANELKLESADIEEDRHKFFDLLALYAKNEPQEPRETPPQNKVKGWNGFVLKRFKKYARQREEMRLLRSNAFSLMRRLFNQLESIYLRNNLLDRPGDIYYLQLDEVFNYSLDFETLINERKAAYHHYQKVQPPVWFSVKEGEMPSLQKTKSRLPSVFNGKGCSPGKVTGNVKVMKKYNLPKAINFDILVTYHTDPGWTPLLALVKGLVVEHGGLLSHAAIVARELEIPTIIGIPGVVDKLKNRQTITLDGDKGEIEVHQKKEVRN